MNELILLSFFSFFIALFTAQAGISGAFLILPLQMSILNFITPAVSSTNLVYNIVAIPSGVYRYVKEKRMPWLLTAIIALGSLPGVFIGALLRTTVLLDVHAFKLFAGLFLAYLGTRLLISARKPSEGTKKIGEKFSKMGKLEKDAIVKAKEIGREVVYEFWGEEFRFSAIDIFILSFLVGIAGGAYGVGGGAIISPFILSIYGLPVYMVAGATLMSTFLTSVFGVFCYSLLGYPPDWQIGASIGVGAFFGMYAGARLQKYMPEKAIRYGLTVVVFAISLRYIYEGSLLFR